ncbi:hypothetical protein ADIAL_1995 [Alkalibacterium sp. AK22]|uniref:hypothetical protein n=1 Tax=Alkalibacterium sp. AK22 TaxID=1229520 RepID=UPI0004537399|nr:hypothetical protein [Alkalibacterium sp. AK22]EXJ22409.1 hypothetical protein ADIAL_1995 [Alkalibacterium sp. AK22]
MKEDKVISKNVNIKEETGTTLVELLAAIAILSLIVTALLAFFIQGAQTNSRTHTMTEATFIAQQEMEDLVYYSQKLSIEDLPDHLAGNEAYDRSGFSVQTRITKANDNLESRLYKVVVEVSKDGQRQALMENRLFFE